MKNKQQQQQARNLYFQTDLTQAQIAKLVGISAKTMSLWVNDEKWGKLKAALTTTPACMIEKLYLELEEINSAIGARAPGQRFALPVEAETRRKILASIRYIKEQQSAGANLEVLVNFIEFIKDFDPDILIPVTRAADYYLKNEKDLGERKLITPYSVQLDVMPSVEDMPVITQTETPPVKDNSKSKNDYKGKSRADRLAMQQWDEFVKNFQKNSGQLPPSGSSAHPS